MSNNIMYIIVFCELNIRKTKRFIKCYQCGIHKTYTLHFTLLHILEREIDRLCNIINLNLHITSQC